MSTTQYTKPCKVREDSAGRKLDSAGKLIKQVSRKDLEKTDFEDPKRQPTFIRFQP